MSVLGQGHDQPDTSGALLTSFIQWTCIYHTKPAGLRNNTGMATTRLLSQTGICCSTSRITLPLKNLHPRSAEAPA